MSLGSIHRAGFSLVEVTLALGVAAFALIAIFGLLPVGLNSNQATLAQTGASAVARAVVADLRATQNSSPATSPSKLYQIPIPVAGTGKTIVTLYMREDGSAAGSLNQNASPAQNPRYRCTLTFNPPSSGRGATPVQVLVTWPALADPNYSAAPSKYSGSFETITALDRN